MAIMTIGVDPATPRIDLSTTSDPGAIIKSGRAFASSAAISGILSSRPAADCQRSVRFFPST
jgi:hypothetical protein